MTEKEVLEANCPECGGHKEIKNVNTGLEHTYYVCDCMMCRQTFTVTVEHFKPKKNPNRK